MCAPPSSLTKVRAGVELVLNHDERVGLRIAAGHLDRAGDDDKEGVAGLALLYQHGAVLEFLRFECLGDVEPLDNAMMCISEQERKRCLRQRP